jgi:protein-tyrosine-phosphatase
MQAISFNLNKRLSIMALRAFNVLFVCERNSARGFMAEALLNRFGGDRFRAFSASIEPDAPVHPLTIEMLKGSGLPSANLKQKSLSEFVTPSAPRMDFVISIGKDVGALPKNFPGKPFIARWGITNPIETSGNLGDQKLAFRRAFRELENRIRLFVLVRHQPQAEPRIEQLPQAQTA